MLRSLCVASLVFAGAGFCTAQEPPKKPGLSDADKAFVMNTAMGGMTEVELGRLASKQATNQEAKSFGQMMVTDHSKINSELKELAEKKSVVLAAKLDDKHQKMVDDLAKLSGANFDRMFIDHMVMHHEKAVADFKHVSKESADGDLKAFATKHLPTLEQHLKTARDIQKKLNESPSDKPKPNPG